MRSPERVAECVAAMRAAVRVPVTVKMRIGVVSASAREARAAVAGYDDEDFARLCGFVRCVSDAGCAVAIVHARKAVLRGLSPKDNRDVPPLRYDIVRRLKQAFPNLPLVVNGGIRSAPAALEVLSWSEGVMLGRESYHRPFVLAELQRALHPQAPAAPSREALLARMRDYAARELRSGGRLAPIVRHMLGLYAGEPGAREFRRTLSEGARDPAAGVELLQRAIPPSLARHA